MMVASTIVPVVMTAAAPDETTILRFRHLLEEHDLGGRCWIKSITIWLRRASAMGAVRLTWRLCFALTSYNNGSTCRILAWKMHFMTQDRFGILAESIWGAAPAQCRVHA
jgi:hypothetical protein